TYLLASVPIARFADRRARAPIVAAALFVWSLMTAASGLVQNYTQLLLARMGVGLGEAGGSPPCHSLLMDYVPPERRARAMAWLPIGALVGVGGGMLYGGWASEVIGWRLALISVGLPGCVLALVFLFTVREPPRRPGVHSTAEALGTGSLAQVLMQLLRNRAFCCLLAATSLAMVSGLARTFWEPSFLRRVYGLGAADTGALYLLIATLPAAIGTWVGAFAADRLAARDARWNAWVPASAAAAFVPFGLAFYLVPPALQVAGVPLGFLLAFVASLAWGGWSAPVMAIGQSLVSPQARAVSAAVWTTVSGFVGGSLGPLLVGDLNVRLQPWAGEEAVRWSLALMALVALFAALAFLALGRNLPREDTPR
ncbi:MAG: MFS transporter, partial [Gammaproteobacteria bacterium]